jgi:hypothetical protein
MELNAMSQSQNNNPEKTTADDGVDPDALMGRINGLSFFAVLIVSLIIHALLIGGTSVGFIQQCVKYQTLAPGAIIREEVKKERAEERAKKLADRQADDAKKVAEEKMNPKKSTKPTTKPLTKIEQDINQKSTTLPATSGVNLDDIDEL